MSSRNIIILALLFAIIVVEIIILAPKEVETAADPLPLSTPQVAVSETTGQVMKDVYSVEAKKEGKDWELWASRALRPKSDQEWTIENVRVKFYGIGGVVYNVVGDEGHVAPNEKGVRDIQIRGHVVTRSSNGYTFKSETIFYDSQNKKLTSPSQVEMTAPSDKDGGQLILSGTDMHADMVTNEISVQRNVKATKKVKSGKELKITSNRAEFSGNSRLAHFIGNVVMIYDTMTLTGPEAEFSYGQTGDALESVHVAGGVRVTDAEKLAVSQSVNVNLKTDEVVFKGSPRVTQNGDELIGDEIVFLDGGRKVKVVNARAQLESESAPGGTGDQEKRTEK